MPVIQRTQTIATVSQERNLISGSAYEFARRAQAVTMGLTQAATGMFATINSGPDVIAEEFEPYIATQYPIVPDQMFYNDVMEMGDRLVISIRNPTGGGIIARTLVQITELR